MGMFVRLGQSSCASTDVSKQLAGGRELLYPSNEWPRSSIDHWNGRGRDSYRVRRLAVNKLWGATPLIHPVQHGSNPYGLGRVRPGRLAVR
jgi:hypothetical protein